MIISSYWDFWRRFTQNPTMVLTPVYFDLLGFSDEQQYSWVSSETARRTELAKKAGQVFCPKKELERICTSNTYRVWEYRHAQDNSAYKIKLKDMPLTERIAYLATALVNRIVDKGWNIDTSPVVISKMARNLLSRMGLDKADPLPA